MVRACAQPSQPIKLEESQASPPVFVFGAWLSLVERLVRDQEAGGSNPLAPTNYLFHFHLIAGG
jgi:hypothetical protein